MNEHKNEYKIIGNLAIIHVACVGETYKVIVDKEDLEKLLSIRWHAHKSNGKIVVAGHLTRDSTVNMPRVILNVTDRKVMVTHKNGNALDNRKENLVMLNRSQLGLVRRKPNKNNKSSGLVGVHWHAQSEKWGAQLMVNRKKIHLGVYDTKEEASAVVEAKRKELLGEMNT